MSEQSLYTYIYAIWHITAFLPLGTDSTSELCLGTILNSESTNKKHKNAKYLVLNRFEKKRAHSIRAETRGQCYLDPPQKETHSSGGSHFPLQNTKIVPQIFILGLQIDFIEQGNAPIQNLQIMKIDSNCFKEAYDWILRIFKFETKFLFFSGMWEFLVTWSPPHRCHVLLYSGIKLAAFSLSFYFLPHREQPIFSTRAHVFQIDPNTKKNWVPTSKHAVTVSYFYDSTRNVYRIISLDGSKVSYISCK